jgi:hypothetical protein
LAGYFRMDAENIEELRQSRYVWIERKGRGQTIWHTDAGRDIAGSFIGDGPPEQTKSITAD